MSQASAARVDWLERYELLAEIASGGMATVYLGRLAGVGGFERLVAIKRLHPHLTREEGFIEMFLDEARIAARLHHPNVVSTLEVVASPRAHYIVMDYVEGDTAARLLGRAAGAGERLPLAATLRIILDTLDGLHAAHELTDDRGVAMGLVHRDVSPQNILVGIDGRSRITDFGVARAATRLASTRSGQLKGKFGYMSPEQVRGDPVDRRSDIFSLGILLWEMLSGQRLFRIRGDSEVEVLHRVVYEDVPLLRTVRAEIPEELERVVRTALSRNPSERFDDCAAFADALEHAATTHQRPATVREVGKLVDQLVGTDVRKRRELARAVGAGECSGVVSNPSLPRLPDGSSGSLPSLSFVEPSRPPEAATRHDIPPPDMRPRGRPWVTIFSVAVIVGILGAGLAAFRSGAFRPKGADSSGLPIASTQASSAERSRPISGGTGASASSEGPTPSASVETAPPLPSASGSTKRPGPRGPGGLTGHGLPDDVPPNPYQ